MWSISVYPTSGKWYEIVLFFNSQSKTSSYEYKYHKDLVAIDLETSLETAPPPQALFCHSDELV